MPWPRILLCSALLTPVLLLPIAAQDSSSSSTSKHTKKAATQTESTIDAGSIANSVYRNKSLALSCKIPDGWVLRTEEMNAGADNSPEKAEKSPENSPEKPEKKDSPDPAPSAGAKVLLAVFSRPPEARAEDVNSSILIAAEPTASYPGLKEAAQYFGPLTEVAKAQGFTMDEDPYAIAIGTRTLVRSDFHKDVGTRVMHQSTLAMLSHGYAVSITIISGTEDDVEELIDGLTFSSSGK